MIDRVTDGRPDLEAAETYILMAVRSMGARILEQVLESWTAAAPDAPVRCACGHTMRSEGRRTKTLRSTLGAVSVRRRLYACPRCGATRFPADEALDVRATSFSPAVRRLMVRAGSKTPFAEAADDLHTYAHVDVTAKDVERVAEATGRQIDGWMQQVASAARLLDGQGRRPPEAPETLPILYTSFDGTGAPMRRSELLSTRGKTAGMSARTREVKLGCVFTQTALDKDGRPVRDDGSTSYVGALENSTEFGYRILGEAVRRGLRQARRVVVLIDGAAYNKTIAAEHFPMALVIIDLFHAREHLTALLDGLLPTAQRAAVLAPWRDLLDAGQIDDLLAAVRARLPRSGPRRKATLKAMHYFEHNAPHMRYADFRAQGLFIGSGVVEAGCRTVIGARFKRSGMFWTVRGLNAIAAARCCLLSHRFEQFWEDRAA
jgi:hypothetical protein